MNSRFRKLAIESLEGRSVLSTMVEADFNGDGYLDLAEITDPQTITVSLNDGNGGYDVSDILSAPRNHTFENIVVHDYEYDGDWDIIAVPMKPSGVQYSQDWRNNGDGTFDFVEPFKWKGRPIRWI
jgi:FG-GAP-like repeat